MNTSTSTPVFAKPVLPAVLKLTVTKEFFDLIKSGEKPEEYREIKPYWMTRLLHCNSYSGIKLTSKEWEKAFNDILSACQASNDFTEELEYHLDNWYLEYKDYSHVEFKNGYSKNAPTIITECNGISIGNPTKQGAQLFKGNVFIISLGAVVWSNCG